jgi:aryl sulfotransferase
MIDWLASYMKSGNTFLRLLLTAYKRGVIDLQDRPIVEADVQPYTHQLVAPAPLTQLTAAEKLYFRSAALLHFMTRSTGQCILKTHSANIRVGDNQIIPQALTNKRILIVRDPRDVAISKANHMSTNIDKSIQLLNEKGYGLDPEGGAPSIVSSWSAHTLSWYQVADLVVKYEDMVSDTHAVLRQVLQVLNWDINEDKINDAVNACQFANLQKQEQQKGFIEAVEGTQFFKVGRSGYWREILTAEQANQIIDDHAEVMELLGYDTSRVSA